LGKINKRINGEKLIKHSQKGGERGFGKETETHTQRERERERERETIADAKPRSMQLGEMAPRLSA
jgi:hypothetical protein